MRRFGITFALLVVSMAGSLIAQTHSVHAVGIEAAIASGQITEEITGTGGSSGDSLRLRIAKRPKAGPGPLEVDIPIGSVFKSSDPGAQDMMFAGVRGVDLGGGMFQPVSKIVLTDTNPVTFILSAFCAQFEKENPSLATSFSVGAQDSTLACIASRGKALSVGAFQSAVWLYTDGLTFDHMSQKFTVTSVEWAGAQNVEERCREAVLGSHPGGVAARGSLIATNPKELAALRELGEFNYTEFKLITGQPTKVFDIVLELTSVYPQKQRFSIILTADDTVVEKKDQLINSPAQFYPRMARLPYEIVVNEVGPNWVSGYLATPKANRIQAAPDLGPSLDDTLTWLVEKIELSGKRRSIMEYAPTIGEDIFVTEVSHQACTIYFTIHSKHYSVGNGELFDSLEDSVAIRLGQSLSAGVTSDPGGWQIRITAHIKLVKQTGSSQGAVSQFSENGFSLFYPERSIAERVVKALNHATELCKQRIAPEPF